VRVKKNGEKLSGSAGKTSGSQAENGCWACVLNNNIQTTTEQGRPGLGASFRPENIASVRPWFTR